MKTRVLFAAVAATASLVAACGGEDPSQPASAGKDAANRKALLDFARCMRKHGVDMPDPQFEGGRVTMREGPGKGTNPEGMRVAEQACAKYRDAVKPPAMSDAQKEEFKQRALANARCMREHGIDMPDPQFDENGGARMTFGRGSGVRPDSQKFKDAQEACRSTMPGGGSTNVEEGGEQ